MDGLQGRALHIAGESYGVSRTTFANPWLSYRMILSGPICPIVCGRAVRSKPEARRGGIQACQPDFCYHRYGNMASPQPFIDFASLFRRQWDDRVLSVRDLAVERGCMHTLTVCLVQHDGILLRDAMFQCVRLSPNTIHQVNKQSCLVSHLLDISQHMYKNETDRMHCRIFQN